MRSEVGRWPASIISVWPTSRLPPDIRLWIRVVLRTSMCFSQNLGTAMRRHLTAKGGWWHTRHIRRWALSISMPANGGISAESKRRRIRSFAKLVKSWSHSDKTKQQRVSPQQLDLAYVALHEIGHALGLRHSSYRHSVMNRYYRYCCECADGYKSELPGRDWRRWGWTEFGWAKTTKRQSANFSRRNAERESDEKTDKNVIQIKRELHFRQVGKNTRAIDDLWLIGWVIALIWENIRSLAFVPSFTRPGWPDTAKNHSKWQPKIALSGQFLTFTEDKSKLTATTKIRLRHPSLPMFRGGWKLRKFWKTQ